MPTFVDLIGLGELLWDEFPDGRRPGGAPANVAYHAQQFGLSAAVATRVGSDDDGRQLMSFLETKNLSTALAQEDPQHPTGRVSIQLSSGSASYVFLENSAWDFLEATPAWLEAFARAKAVCFGTLAQRGSISCETIHRCLAATSKECLRVFDINLRSPFYDRTAIDSSLRLAGIVKLNDEEVGVIKEMFDVTGDDDVAVGTWILRQYELDLVCITRGDRGAAAITPDHVSEVEGIPVPVVDTVGAGDAFTAALLWSRFQEWPIERGLALANRTGALMAGLPGAMPDVAEQYRQLVAEFS